MLSFRGGELGSREFLCRGLHKRVGLGAQAVVRRDKKGASENEEGNKSPMGKVAPLNTR